MASSLVFPSHLRLARRLAPRSRSLCSSIDEGLQRLVGTRRTDFDVLDSRRLNRFANVLQIKCEDGEPPPSSSSSSPSSSSSSSSTSSSSSHLATVGDPIRSTAHWLFHTDGDLLNIDEPFGSLGPDGNPELVPGYRRMWAGGSFKFRRPLRVGDRVRKRAEVVSVATKDSKTYGPVIFVKRRCVLDRLPSAAAAEEGVGNRSGNNDEEGDDEDDPARWHEQAEVCLEETLDHVYMLNTGYKPPAQEMQVPQPPATAPSSSSSSSSSASIWHETAQFDEVSLFRYSALTWNSHRVHYDPAYARDGEGYPNTVVHGPLLCTLLLDMYQRRSGVVPVPAIPPRDGSSDSSSDSSSGGYQFEYRSVRPLFLPDLANIWGMPSAEKDGFVDLFAANGSGHVCMKATAGPLSDGGDKV